MAGFLHWEVRGRMLGAWRRSGQRWGVGGVHWPVRCACVVIGQSSPPRMGVGRAMSLVWCR